MHQVRFTKDTGRVARQTALVCMLTNTELCTKVSGLMISIMVQAKRLGTTVQSSTQEISSMDKKQARVSLNLTTTSMRVTSLTASSMEQESIFSATLAKSTKVNSTRTKSLVRAK